MKASIHPGVSIVVPVYNSEEVLSALLDRLSRAVDALNLEHEIILVNDGSPDRSGEVIAELEGRYARVRGINLLRNFGQHNALLCGIRAARFDRIVTLDDDLQNPPEEIGKLLGKLSEGYDVVYGTPEKERHGLFRDSASVITKLALRGVIGVEVARSVSAFRAFRTQLSRAFSEYRGPFVNMDVLLSWGAVRYAAVPVRHEKRTVGRSHYSMGKLIRHAMNMITGFSVLPLQFATVCGFVTVVFGIGVLAYVIGKYFIAGSAVAGFPFLASIITIFAGAQLFSLGIIGEYLARMHFRMMDRPSYVVAMDGRSEHDGDR